ncbi:MAG: hypothetical protein ABJB66_14800 [Gemmatimonadaceae bacterium]
MSRNIRLSVSLALVGAIPLAAIPNVRSPFHWDRLTGQAAFPTGYNFPVHVASDGKFVALHPEGTWTSTDGTTWTKSALPFSGTNAAYLPYLKHDGATYVFGSHKGNYLKYELDNTVRKTTDYKTWTTVGRSSTLPKLIFYGTASFRGAMWIVGGYDGKESQSSVWRSTDGLNWTLAVARAPWSPRNGAKTFIFRDRLYIIGGSLIDKPDANDVWSSADGVNWVQETNEVAPERPFGYAPIVFRDRVFLIGANRSGQFTSEMLFSSDGKRWQPVRAPWSPRGGVTAWSDSGAVYITGGKYSTVVNGETVFSYVNDVWRMKVESM